MEENVASTTPEATSFLDLNVDCLLRIFELLPLQDKIHCALACRGLLHFYIEEITPAYKKFSKDEILTLCQLTQAHLSCFLEATAQFIEEIDICNTKFDTNVLVPLFRYGTNIKKVNISNCRLTDYTVKPLRQLSNLQVLRLDSNFDITGEHIATLCNLEELYLAENCLEAKHVQQIVQSCNNLRMLDIRDFQMDAETSHVIAQNCHKLETLRFRNDDADFSDLARLPNLRGLVMSNAKLAFLRTLAEHKAEQLEDLRIVAYILESPLIDTLMQFKNLKILYWEADNLGGSFKTLCNLKKLEKVAIAGGRSVRDDLLLTVLKECTNLNYMALLAFSCVTEAFVLSAIELLKQRIVERKQQNKALSKPFVLVSTNIENSIFENKQYLDASSILKLHSIKPEDCDFQDKFLYDC